MKRNRHSPNEKAKIVLETFRGEKTLSEIAAENNVHPNLLSKWKKTAITGLETLFEEENLQKRRILKAHEEEKSELYKQIGKLTTEVVEKKICTIRFVSRNVGSSLILQKNFP